MPFALCKHFAYLCIQDTAGNLSPITKKAALSVRIEASIKKAIDEYAAATGRSTASMVQITLREFLQNRFAERRRKTKKTTVGD
jgi:hypothetical protein